MRIASLLRSGVYSKALKSSGGQQKRLVAGSFIPPQEGLSACKSSGERWMHSRVGRATHPSYYAMGWQLRTQETRPFSEELQKRWASSGTADAIQEDLSSKGTTTTAERPVVYWGPLSGTLRKVKVLSLTSCCLSVMTAPAITFLTSPHVSIIVKGGIAATVILLSASTTAALHWCVGPYVHKLKWVPGAKEIEVEMVTWMATYQPRTILIEDIRPAKTNRPFVSFAAKDKFYFVDTEKIPNKELVRIVSFFSKGKMDGSG